MNECFADIVCGIVCVREMEKKEEVKKQSEELREIEKEVLYY